MSGYQLQPVALLHDQATGAPIGMMGRNGKEYLFPLVNDPDPTANYVDKSGTPGAATINAYRGRVAAAAAATSLVVTNNRVTATSYIGTNLATNDSTAVIKAVVPAAGSFTIYLTAPTAQVNIDFIVLG